MNTIEILKAARAKIASPERWTQRHMAKARLDETSWTYVCAADDQEATCWCALGAIRSFGKCAEGYEAINELESEVLHLPRFNDSSTHADVIALFDRTIARLESQ